MSGRKETVLDLAKFVDKGVQVKLTGGRQGTLKGYDQLLNLVLDEAVEFLRGWLSHWEKWKLMLEPEFLTTVRMLDKGCSDANMCASLLLGIKTILNMDRDVQWCHVVRENPDDPLKTTDQNRSLGLIVFRGTAVMLVSPTDGTDEIANPFIQPDGA
ncbi:Sm-like protein LSM7 [Glycine soja]